ncbi:hypothetical protein RvY_00764 [Ramazzottius varieornatus]|uniref:Uncharacterized protein n=1 Tax=Ramazzottius varieornatus TaxID=947166 RepID=A0A1D1UP97_RAMVA|nr:hypothetical protein RvY_00764 [Ramazzottius varieornatus]
MDVVFPKEVVLYSQNYDNRREKQKREEKEVEEERESRAKEMEYRMTYCAERAVSVDAIEGAIMREGTGPSEPSPENISIETAVLKPMKRKYSKNAEKVPPTKRRTRKS